MIGAAVAVFPSRSPELAHGDYRYVGHPITHVLVKSRQSLAEVGQQIGELALRRRGAHFVDVGVPTANVGEGYFQAQVGALIKRAICCRDCPSRPPGYFAPLAGV